MEPTRYLELLNKRDKTPKEVEELEAEFKRQEDAAKAAAPKDGLDEESKETLENFQAPTQPEEEKKEGVDDGDGSGASEQPTVEATPSPEISVEQTAETVAEQQVGGEDTQVEYSFEQLAAETGEALAFLETKDNTFAVRMAKASFEQGQYWVNQAHEGK